MSENRTDVRYENFTFQDIMTVQPFNYELTEQDISSELVPADFAFVCFKAKFKNSGAKFIATSNETDRHNWMRVMRLIAQMNRLQINAKLCNLFAFEQAMLERF